MMSESKMPQRRQLPKLIACVTKTSLENMRNQALFCLDVLDAKGIRRYHAPYKFAYCVYFFPNKVAVEFYFCLALTGDLYFLTEGYGYIINIPRDFPSTNDVLLVLDNKNIDNLVIDKYHFIVIKENHRPILVDATNTPLCVQPIRRKMPLHECLMLELRESGFTETADYFQDLLYDNAQLVAEDEIGIVVDIRKRPDYLEHITETLIKAEKKRDKGEIKKECLYLLGLALEFAEKGKGILWLAEKFYLASIAVGSQYLIDGGRQKACCKYHYAKFLLDKFPGNDVDEPFHILTEVRDCAIGKSWPVYEPSEENPNEEVPPDILFQCTAIQLHRVLLSKSRAVRKSDTGRSERLARLAERRAKDAKDISKVAEAIIEIGICQLAMNNLNNAQKTFERAFIIYTEGKNIEGLCDTRMHMAAVMQRMGNHEKAAKLLTEMGAMAMEYGLRLHLGRALHLLGELHLRREKPELGTQHLTEAFGCFMGTSWQQVTVAEWRRVFIVQKTVIRIILKRTARHDRHNHYLFRNKYLHYPLSSLTSLGQEHMASFFNIIRECASCTIAQIRLIEWKLDNAPWWVIKRKHDLLPCMCPQHNRSPLEVLRIKIEIALALDRQTMYKDSSLSENLRGVTVEDLRKLHSTVN